LTPVPTKEPRPAEVLSKFVDKLQGSETAFEVIVGQGKILNLKEDLGAAGKPMLPLLAVGDPAIVGLVVVNPRQIRVVGQRLGVTDLSVTTAANKTYIFEVHVVADLDILRNQLHSLFPDASLRLAQIRDQIVVEGQARDGAQVARIIETIRAYGTSIQLSMARQALGTAQGQGRQGPAAPEGDPGTLPAPQPIPGGLAPGLGRGGTQALGGPIRVLNLIRVPTSSQVLLKVRIAELERTALRQIGTDILYVNPSTGATVGTQIGGATINSVATATGRLLTASATTTSAQMATTAFGIFEGADFALFLSALRRNSLVKILAEPNLVALNGQQASFLAGGEFPVPVPQYSAGGAAATVTVQFKEFGVRLGFLPFILDGGVIRLTVDPEVSNIDPALAATLVPGGQPVPGIDTRRTHTTVEMREGQTLMISGLLQLQLNANTSRIPGLGDLPFVGPLFSNTSSTRTETELVVLVTPYLIEPMNPGEVGPTPGDDVGEPTDLELYLRNRIESRKGVDFRSTLSWNDPLHLRALFHLENRHLYGPHGFADFSQGVSGSR
jgi:pilus assembly protein CpaC